MAQSKKTKKPNKSFRDSFLNFLAAVALRSDRNRQPKRGDDGLIHFNLKLLVNGGITLEEPNRHGYYRSGKHHFLSLQWEDEPLDGAVAEAKKLCPYVSDKLIKQTLRQAMIRLFNDQVVRDNPEAKEQNEETKRESGEIDSILDLLDTSQANELLVRVIEWLNNQVVSQTVYVPIEGIELNENVTIGDVEFYSNAQEGELHELVTKIEQGHGEFTRMIENAPVFAKTAVVGDDIFAIDKALHKTKEAVYTINFGLSSTLHQPSYAKVRIADIVINSHTPTESSDEYFIGSNLDFPKSRNLVLGKQKIQEHLGAFHVNILKAESSHISDWRNPPESLTQSVERLLAIYQTNGDIAKRIQRAVTWYGKAVDADTHDEQFVNLAVALESLLIGDEGSGPYTTSGSISQNLGERTAFLLKSDFEARDAQLKQTKKLYGRRSAIVHRGESVTVEELKDMDDLVKSVTFAFLQHNFQCWDDFLEWIARQKFSQKAMPTTETQEANND